MALDIETTVHQLRNGEAVKLFDSTGTNNGSSYPDGWSDGVNGLANPQQSDCDQCIIVITKGDLTHTETLTGSDLTNYLDPMTGITLEAATIFGSTYAIFEDGIYTITVTFSGPTIQGSPSVWSYDDEFQEAFQWNLWNKIRLLACELEVPVKKYPESYNVALLNTLSDSVYFLCQFGEADKATEVMEYLNEILDTNTQLTEIFKNYQNYE